MKPVLLCLQLFVFALHGGAQYNHTVNAVLGDESFLVAFGTQPTAVTDEILRLQTHLAYVEHLLFQRDVSQLRKEQREIRLQVLQRLHEYRLAGIFPKNYDHPGRRPCFIDRDGNICAVGYLIEKTAGRELAESINQNHQYDYLLDMGEDAIAEWADEHGLTLEECAMIQPAYSPWPPYTTQNAPVKTGYGIASGFAVGINAGVNVLNLGSRYGNGKNISYIGLVSGTSQIVLGLANIHKDESTPAAYSYKAQNNLSYLNIATGTATVFTSALNLLLNKKVKDKRNVFNMYGHPSGRQQVAAGLSFTRAL